MWETMWVTQRQNIWQITAIFRKIRLNCIEYFLSIKCKIQNVLNYNVELCHVFASLPLRHIIAYHKHATKFANLIEFYGCVSGKIVDIT